MGRRVEWPTPKGPPDRNIVTKKAPRKSQKGSSPPPAVQELVTALVRANRGNPFSEWTEALLGVHARLAYGQSEPRFSEGSSADKDIDLATPRRFKDRDDVSAFCHATYRRHGQGFLWWVGTVIHRVYAQNPAEIARRWVFDEASEAALQQQPGIAKSNKTLYRPSEQEQEAGMPAKGRSKTLRKPTRDRSGYVQPNRENKSIIRAWVDKDEKPLIAEVARRATLTNEEFVSYVVTRAVERAQTDAAYRAELAEEGKRVAETRRLAGEAAKKAAARAKRIVTERHSANRPPSARRAPTPRRAALKNTPA